MKPALREYYNRHMTDGTFVSWLAVDGDKIVGTIGMTFVDNHHILAALVERWGYFQVCLPLRNIEDRALQKNYYPES